MTPRGSVLIGFRREMADADEVRTHLEDWVGELGFETRVTVDPQEAVDWAHREPFTAGFVDAGWEVTRGQSIWRVLQPVLARRMVLMTRTGRRDLWFEALRYGVAAVLPLPPEPSSVRAALRAAAPEAGPPMPPNDPWRRS
ncbi:MAG: hypothetical protein QNJ98_01495 [Planctomycetota bacterium]|nr:hypothetical protein [Planctomycetota bacterium]